MIKDASERRFRKCSRYPFVFNFNFQQHDTRNPQPGMILSTHVSSSKGGGTKSLEGLNLSLSER